MALPDTGPVSRWLLDRLRNLFLDREGMMSRGETPQRKGLVVTVCLLASILLWFTFAMSKTYTRVMDFPTEVTNLAPDEALSDLPPKMIRAQVEGEGIQLLRLYYDPPTVYVDAASRVVDLEVTAPESIQNVRIDAVTPRTVTVFKERREMRRLPLRSRVEVLTEPGHHVVGGVQFEPDSVTVSGAASIVARMNYWPTETITLNTGSDSLDAVVELADTLSGLVTVETTRIAARASVRQFTQGSRRVPVRVIGAPAGQRVSLEPAEVTVVYQVPLDSYEEARVTADLYAFVSYETMRRDTTGAVRPEIHLPAQLVFRGVNTQPAALRYYFDVMGLD